ncbi:hypothetical protein PDESU_04778 [Pontiella desulfatans]|uniref:Uncharacterized protein n=1 Tax=Pontiella desulfatans TaxID=2750659 RepID=A0A6C2U7W4_PONDE|nr:DUF6557 family protein [Pontiella desulfatans]VGO16188.1 hypothetical protein PDESU_04778 [Pontiella desulfatans]
MTLYDLFHRIDWAALSNRLAKLYPDQANQLPEYEAAFNSLRLVAPEETRMRIIVQQTFREGLDDEPFVEVSGKDGTLNKEQDDFQYMNQASEGTFANRETSYALSLSPWNEWLGMEIDAATAEHYSDEDILAHCLWEMTWHGFEEESIQEQKKELDRRVAEIAAMTDEEKKEKLIPWEDVKQRLKDKFNRDDQDES